MRSNKNRLKDAKLYLILDAQVLDHARLLKVLKESVRFGIGIVQLRDKFGTAKDILIFCKHALKITKHQVPLILNDRVDLAILSGVDGVHVGQEDIGCKDARCLLGPKAIIGVSCQNLLQARQAVRDGADYIGFGSVFKTQTKPERNLMNLNKLQKVLKEIKIPIYPIGGINRLNVNSLKEYGVQRVAMCRDILLAQNIGNVVKETTSILG